jgi:uncharacterized protein
VQALPSTATVPAGGYFLIQEIAGANTALPFPTPDFAPATPFSMGAGSGKVALTSSITALTGACPLGLTSDFVGYGITANTANGCFEGTGGTGAPSNTTAALRNGGGCIDTNANNVDFTVTAPAPRNSATTASVCSCP